MSIVVYNLTEWTLVVVEYYVGLGHNEAESITIAAGKKENVSVQKLLNNVTKRLVTQEIHVKRGEETLYTWHHYDFVANEGKCCFLEIGYDGVFRPRFETRPTENQTGLQWIWNKIRFRGAGVNAEAGVVAEVLMYADELEAGIPVD